MLKLNVWTSSLGGKRPVMVYLHGGGYFFGSAYELASQNGAQIARHHDVVSVTVNHRLGRRLQGDDASSGCRRRKVSSTARRRSRAPAAISPPPRSRASSRTQGNGNGPRAQALARKMATAWASFARTGNPSQPGLPWASFDPDRSPTMVFDDDCRMVDDPEAEARKILLG